MIPRDPYFVRLQHALRAAGICEPVLVVDLDRLDQNVDTLRAALPAGMALRVVAKSLPAPRLLAHVGERAGTQRLMTFSRAMLLDAARALPGTAQLLGKPLPAAALQRFLSEAPADARVHWLLDTPARLAAYADIADAQGAMLDVVLELDVGLHRGGFVPDATLRDVLATLHASPCLRFAGFMGYEPHVAALPAALGWRRRALAAAREAYAAALAMGAEVFGAARIEAGIRNAGGSPTYRLYTDTQVANELAVGSALVKPTDFDIALLADHVPAAFIATPVLKAPGRTRLPGLEFADGLRRFVHPDAAHAFFIHGGHWLAEPVDPPRLSYNRVFGRSSNQEMLNGPAGTDLAPDDFVFLRPHQSEAVLLQFGDLVIVRDGAVVDTWPTFPVSA